MGRSVALRLGVEGGARCHIFCREVDVLRPCDRSGGARSRALSRGEDKIGVCCGAMMVVSRIDRAISRLH